MWTKPLNIAVSVLGLALVLTMAALPALAGPGPGSGGTTLAKVEGTISAINLTAGSVTITTRAGAQVTVLVTPATKIERNSIRVPLSALKVGDRGQARYDPISKAANKVESVG